MSNQFKVEVSHAGSMTVNFADVLYIPIRTKEELWQVLQTLSSPEDTDGFKYLNYHFTLPKEIRRQKDDKAILHAWLLCNTVTKSKRYKKKKPDRGFTLEVLGLGKE